MKKFLNLIKKHKVPIIISIIGMVSIYTYYFVQYNTNYGPLVGLNLLMPYIISPIFVSIVWIVYFVIKCFKDFKASYIIDAICVPFVVVIIFYLGIHIDVFFLNIFVKDEPDGVIKNNLSKRELDNLFEERPIIEFDNKYYYVNVNRDTLKNDLFSVNINGKNNKVVCENINDVYDLLIIKNKDLYYIEEDVNYDYHIKKINLNSCSIDEVAINYEYAVNGDDDYLYFISDYDVGMIAKYDYKNNKIVKTIEYSFDSNYNDYIFISDSSECYISYNKELGTYDLFEKGVLCNRLIPKK